MSTKITIDDKAIRKLARLLEEVSLSEIEYENDGCRIRVSKQIPGGGAPYTIVTSNSDDSGRGESAEALSAPVSREQGNQPNWENHHGLIKSPMVGTAYLAPEPGSPVFVKVGDMIEVGHTLLVLEAMKVMNPIKAARAGKVIHVFVKNGAPVEFGEPLCVIE
ncbi:MAG: acetyl-CoA carboxylase biotin carboxyl carrier protein [Alphaproteobacteria bacterium]|nr:acetyl-CoA carboxylase biotin carboxyl carrier protein [Alphaproteobacteria bacterium]